MRTTSKLIIGGYHPASFIDYPGRVAAVIFFQGCNFHCPYCHNAQLIPQNRSPTFSSEEILKRLHSRRGKLSGVVLTGGEPTLQTGLLPFCKDLQEMGYPLKLDTNGSNPELLEQLLDQQRINYVAMDLKAPLSLYSLLAGKKVDTAALQRSVEILSTSGVPHHFRTTYDQTRLSKDDLLAIKGLVPSGSAHVVQACR
ncbi:anaerobic ribonucleoside-triphosphate reductase activating protein [Desulfobulbus rhabdoformis]|jgi:pyruvate formate lyase activating enzyme|uniref:anaerobic ribonucleoside-triphosphate reductase activating protein n=1 Tax=Desulfobulbus rhabdoformis TaxID=34032 RepID=UPI001966BD25|nr:anaerobic ribonucleoside-triphosphate reductase activating protein [Desulfobulbus rhabdoformis]MBM9612808.1 anaerobic ribonucleoside-triphosphate reductase activating protein [Desulfobulbus rhabdoformis]